MANLTEQFKGWIKDMGDTMATVASINLRFTTSTEYPLTMGELADFLNENRDFLECHNIEWCSDYSTSSGDKVQVAISLASSYDSEGNY